MAALQVQEPNTKVTFPAQRKFWNGSRLRSLGAALRLKRVVVNVKVYAFTVYVEPGPAVRAIKAAASPSDAAVAAALLDAEGSSRALHMHLVRNVTGEQFVDALDDGLKASMRDEPAPLAQLREHFAGKRLESGTSVVLLWRPEGVLEGMMGPAAGLPDLSAACPANQLGAWLQVTPEFSIASQRLCKGIFELYLGQRPISQDARKVFLAGARALAAEQ